MIVRDFTTRQRPRVIPGPFSSRQAGFTLTELIVVIVLAGILAAVALPRWLGDTGFSERGLRDETMAGLRYAQKSAVAARRLVCVSFTANSMSAAIAANFVDANCSTGGPLPGPSGGALAVSASGGATYATLPAGGAMTFDAQGRPSAGAMIAIQGLSAALNITVEAETGYVH